MQIGVLVVSQPAQVLAVPIGDIDFCVASVPARRKRQQATVRRPGRCCGGTSGVLERVRAPVDTRKNFQTHGSGSHPRERDLFAIRCPYRRQRGGSIRSQRIGIISVVIHHVNLFGSVAVRYVGDFGLSNPTNSAADQLDNHIQIRIRQLIGDIIEILN